MLQCLECQQTVATIDNRHLAQCCGLTLQEYALRHKLPLDILVSHELLNHRDDVSDYAMPEQTPRHRAQLIVTAIEALGLMQRDQDFLFIAGEVRRLDQLFWLQQGLQDYGFQFRQEYVFNDRTHRVVASNKLKTIKRDLVYSRASEIEALSTPDFLLFLSIAMALGAEFYGGYLFLKYAHQPYADVICQRLAEQHKITLIVLEPIQHNTILLRARSRDDTRALLHLLKAELHAIPHSEEHFYRTTPQASVTKELVFDSAHFITDHPGSCANLHGGRYNLHVTLHDQIDPYTGFVMDYGYLKTVVEQRVIQHLDHKNLNLADAALSWRSTTELLSAFIWQQLIDYLPNLSELLIYETDRSYCRFSGPTLEALQQGAACLPTPFDSPHLGQSLVRRRTFDANYPVRLELVKQKRKP